MKEFRFDELLKKDGEYIIRLSADGKAYELSAHGANIEVTAQNSCGASDMEGLLDALPRLCAPAAFIISGAAPDLRESAILSAAEKNWSIVI